ncbi:hypothetical protein Sango_1572500 [Sesamum angolense]|uniref:Uncharacterized protein n=1 Tax=Sesamum angolense TaxID=2727404 RepID=A0AAE1WPY0_9LAMI|nr:hypothetical protein Sango_1572500 [Sesamum angolense]
MMCWWWSMICQIGGDDHHTRIYGDGKDADVIEDDEDSFGRTLGEVASWDQMRTVCRNEKDLLGETCKEEKWLKCAEFDQKGIVGCSTPKLTKPLNNDEAIDPDVGLAGYTGRWLLSRKSKMVRLSLWTGSWS